MSDESQAAEAVSIKIRENGPLLVAGPISVVDHEGNQVVCEGANTAFCRCGLSENKPFCDGRHQGNFDGTLAAD